MIWPETLGNGARTGTIRTTTKNPESGILKGPNPEWIRLSAEEVGRIIWTLLDAQKEKKDGPGLGEQT